MPRRRKLRILNFSRSTGYKKHFTAIQNLSRATGDRKPYTVKIQNLSKSTDKINIMTHTRSSVSLSDIVLMSCPDSPTDYAYINCCNFETAQYLVKLLHNSILDKNRITAKIKGEEFYRRHGNDLHSSTSSDSDSLCDRSPSPEVRRHSRSRSRSPVSCRVWQTDTSGRGRVADSTDCNASTSSSGISTNTASTTVKVSVHGKGLTEADLDEYFEMYGSLTSKTILRPGQPDYAFINFDTASAAQAACNSSAHYIKDVLVTARPKSSKSVASTVCDLGLGHQLAKLAGAVLPCNPLVVEKAHKEMAQHFQDSRMVKVEPVKDRIVVHVPQQVAESATTIFKQIIQKHEAKIKSVIVPLNLCFCPALASKNFCKKISDLDSKFDLNIEINGEIRSLEQFQGEWEHIEKNMLMQISQSSSSDTGSEYQWYWLDDGDSYRPYGYAANEDIEAAYQSKASVTLFIAAHSYDIDTINKQQVNKATHRRRSIQRKKFVSKQGFTLILHLSSYENDVEDVKKEILKSLDCVVCENKVHLPDSLHDLESFVKLLLFAATQRFVQASFDREESFIVVRGIESQVTQVVNELQTRILEKQHELGRISLISFPTTWAPQEGNCELKMVPDKSPEWSLVENLFLGPGFDVQIVKIQRIQNKWLYEAYVRARDRIYSKNGREVNEKQLFHGTRETLPKAIYDSEHGFDNRMASPGLYGEGAYFAERSSYSDSYAHKLEDGCRQMFLAKVVTGKAYECKETNSSLKAPPFKSSHDSSASTGCKFEGERYDSVTATTNGCKIYVIYELGKVYPEYLITYRYPTRTLGHSSLF